MLKKLNDKIRNAIINWLCIKMDLEALWEVTSQAYDTGEKHSHILGKAIVDIEQLWDVVRIDHQSLDQLTTSFRSCSGATCMAGMDIGKREYTATIQYQMVNGKLQMIKSDIKEVKA
jgi:hypothetical protein